ncbi:MAG: FG-GAP repeat protein, partial [Candidatus Aenigmarchaeota archaeon]|nr:FG-GAP repeat protein [Candidatus Aenigmarchaeota archaeon]
MKKKIIFLLLCILIIFTVAQLSASTHHFDSEGFCIQSSQAKVIDLRIEDANITLYNNAHKNGTGYSVASGDINNDGTDDFIISTISSIPSIVLPERANVVQAIFGKSDFPATTAINLSDIDTVDLTIFWQHPSSSDFGFSVATGDINGDGIPDIAMTSRRAVFALYGSENLRGLINLAVQDANISIDFNGVSSYFGFSIALGDVNGDSFDDLVFSDSQYKEGGDDTGKVYVVYGRGDGNFRLDLLAEGADITIRGERAGNWIGNDLAVEDINNDGIEDILIGA